MGDPMSAQDPRAMSRDDLVAYFDGGGDVSELPRDAPGPERAPQDAAAAVREEAPDVDG